MKAETAKHLGVIGLLGLVVAGPWAGLMMYVAREHNPQGEFHEVALDGTRLVHWWDWLAVGASWFIPVFVFVVALGVILRAAISFARRRTV